LYTDAARLDKDVMDHLSAANVTVRPYQAVYDDLKSSLISVGEVEIDGIRKQQVTEILLSFFQIQPCIETLGQCFM
jgi:hypothetical protein